MARAIIKLQCEDSRSEAGFLRRGSLLVLMVLIDLVGEDLGVFARVGLCQTGPDAWRYVTLYPPGGTTSV
jgi:hypothetical protein